MSQKVYLNILNQNQKDLLPLIKQFQADYYLVGGTAIALLLGHRESIDFDLFTNKNKNQLKTKANLQSKISDNLVSIFEGKDQAHFILNGVKLTFFNFPHVIPVNKVFEGIRMPNLLTLAAMKAFALGGRAKWKDYVDLYFILNQGVSLDEIIIQADSLFNSSNSTLFNYRNFMEQLMYYNDVSYEEEVTYVGLIQPTNEEIKKYLTDVSIDFLKNKALN